MGVRTPASLHLPKRVPAKNAPDFPHPNKDIPKTRPVLDPNLRRGTFWGRMLLRPTRVREKFGGFHIPPPGYAKNAPDFTLPNRDTPKTCPVLGASLCRRTFRGVCNTPLHGYAKNAPGFTLSNKDSPKTYPILGANPCRRTFRGVCNTPLHGYTQNQPGFRPKPSAQDISGRMQYAPTRVRAKPARFHISAHEYAKNAPDFTLSNKDSPKTYPILSLNLRRRTFWGVCFCALHGCTQNPLGFRPKSLAQDISGRMLLRPTRVRAKFGGFHISAHGYTKNPPGFRRKPSARGFLGRMQ